MTDRYATNAFINIREFEDGLFTPKNVGKAGSADNPSFLYPPKTLKNAANGSAQPIQRGYMRMITSGMTGLESLSKRRLHFQFNPDSIVRAVTARNDIQFWMNQTPSELVKPIPGDANFAFELLFNREAEIASGTYSDNGTIRESRVKAELPLTGAGNENTQSVEIPHNAVTDIGVLSDLMVFDEIIGQGINTQLIEQVLKNATNRQNITNASRGSTSDTPDRTAVIVVKKVSSAGVVTEVEISNPGSGYINTPAIAIDNSGTNGSGLALTVDISNREVIKVTIVSGGSGYSTDSTKFPKITLTGGGGGGSTSSAGTADGEDVEVQTEFNEQEARQNLYNNFGNSAFIVASPIRVVFSSLFIVEGYVTSTMVTFNKFNANMVPTQCSVGISMQALYIGFARKDTFMTLSLKQLEDKYNASTTSSDNQPGYDNTPFIPGRGGLSALEKLARNMWQQKVGRGTNTGVDSKDDIKPAQIFDDGDYTQTWAFRLTPTKELVDNVRSGAIAKITQEGVVNIRYLGNTLSPTSIGDGTFQPGVPIIKDMVANSEFNIKQLRNNDGELVLLKFTLNEDQRLGTGERLDKTDTSKYQVDYKVTFTIHTSKGEVITASQYYLFNQVMKFDEGNSVTKTDLAKPSYLKTTYRR
jgi:hypothetical protein